mmetsp:Transcript_12657/g.18646  ORF Transcript_12657/g.18646 Transcript_12657/m.18646 type:complete len:261 (-) Transcript_12657:60-842(-)|eukprot:CAMPEP_0113943794 /NCGR_PEP_ID=MMETSP1339-20121228/27941_1 /TAXON_ID=94617 /ORGANISM="Fibrocapsa japonica" /LENGTH=260 /DNA_ID=CAMNT_0000948751 /DNA_START=60 /DNA_END=842 /DNA_ORIENTATION=- /assembly_acc=CAM_ASM_000762
MASSILRSFARVGGRSILTHTGLGLFKTRFPSTTKFPAFASRQFGVLAEEDKDQLDCKAHDTNKLDACWSCGERHKCKGFFCGCGAIQPLRDATNYFEILKCPVHFDLDMKFLESNFWALQKKLHPDLFSHKSQEEQEFSAMNSSMVNNAYQTLRDPVERVKYLLGLYGMDVLSETSNEHVDGAFLMEVMEARESIEDAGKDSIEEVIRENKDKIVICLGTIKSLFDQHDLTGMAQEAVKLQYFTRIHAEATEKQHQMEL